MCTVVNVCVCVCMCVCVCVCIWVCYVHVNVCGGAQVWGGMCTCMWMCVWLCVCMSVVCVCVCVCVCACAYVCEYSCVMRWKVICKMWPIKTRPGWYSSKFIFCWQNDSDHNNKKNDGNIWHMQRQRKKATTKHVSVIDNYEGVSC